MTPNIIDIHFHADARPEGGGDLPKVAEWMEKHHVSRLIVLPLERTLPGNETEQRRMADNFKAYRGKIYQFCVLFPHEVHSKDAAVIALKAFKNGGAIGFGEHYGRGLNFDDPKCMQLYEACAVEELPVLFHMDNDNNRDDAELSHLENALKAYPNCVFIGHGPGFWSRMEVVDHLMSRHDNLYADISAGSGARAIGRDKGHSRDFMVRHSERVLFGTDGGPWSLGVDAPPQFELIDALDLPIAVNENICRSNAINLFNFDGLNPSSIDRNNYGE